ANGYFVLMPDIVYRGREPGTSALEAVEPAVKAVVDRGLVDSARIGLVGHSWGGYQATYLPTRTRIFAAAVAGAPITNFLSFAGAIHWTPGNPEFDHWETGQARMDVPPWEDFEAYLRNSPIHKVQDLKTPMLMMFGDADGTVDWHQGIEFYNFARRAGRNDFVLLVYPGEDHGLRKKENQIDYHRRILQWFGHWLKGEPAPKWITEGVTWLDRKKLLENAPK
ncbi:MAG: alpha/beta hydrolase family protein, partial [Longimicrobiales bacterium]